MFQPFFFFFFFLSFPQNNKDKGVISKNTVGGHGDKAI